MMLYQQRALWEVDIWETLHPKTYQGKACEGWGVILGKPVSLGISQCLPDD